MHRKLASLLVACALGAALSGCKKDALVESVLADFDAFTQEIVKRVEGAPDPSAGVDDAQRYFDSRRPEIEGKLRSIKGIHNFQLSEETRRKMTEQMTDDLMSVSKLQLRYAMQSARDPNFQARLAKLIGDYQGLIRSLGEG